MGRIPIAVVAAQDSMSGSGGKSSRKPVSPLNVEKMAKTAAEKLSVGSNDTSGHFRSALKVAKSEDAGRGRATSVFESVNLCSDFQTVFPKDLERRKKVHDECNVQRGKSPQGEISSLRSETQEYSSAAGRNMIMEKRIVGDVKGKSAGAQPGFFRQVTRFPRQKFPAEPEMWFKAGRSPAKFVPNDGTRRRTNDSSKNTPQSPSGSESSSSFSTFGSSSFSNKSEASAFAKGEFSPRSTKEAELRPGKFQDAKSGAAQASTQGGHARQALLECDGKLLQHSTEKQEQHAKAEFLEFSFLEGVMVESRIMKNDYCSLISSDDHSNHGEEELHNAATNAEVSDEEWADGLSTPAFYSASGRSPETCSEASRCSGDANCCQLSTIDGEFKQVPIRELISGARHSLRAHLQNVESEKQAQDCHTQSEIDVNRMRLNSDAQPRKTNSIVRSDIANSAENISVNSSSHHQEDNFSFQLPLLMNGSKPNSGSSLYPSSSPNICKHAAEGKRTVAHHCMQDDMNFSEQGALRTPLLNRPALKSPLPHRHLRKNSEALPLSPLSPVSFRGAKSSHDESFEKERTETFKLQPPIPLSCAKSHWDWRSRSLGARASLRSAVRNLEAAFAGSRSMSLPKTRAQNPSKDSRTENSSFLERVFVSPARTRQRHVEILKPSQRTPHQVGHLLQDTEHMGKRVSSRRDEEPFVYIQKSLSMHSNSNSTLACALPNSVPRGMPLIGYKYRSSDLEISCKPFLPTSKSVRCLPVQNGAFGPGNVALSSQKLASLSSSRSGVAPSNMLQGYMQCILRDGVPCFTLSIDDSEEMLLARTSMSEIQCNKDGCKWMYTFHSGRSKAKGKGMGGWKSWMRKDKTTSDLAAKMKVSSVVCPEVDATGVVKHSVVSEFVLFDGRAEDAVRSQSLRFLSSRVAGQNRSSLGSMREASSSVPHSSGIVSPMSISRMHMAERQNFTSSTNASVGLETDSTQPQLSSPIKGTVGHRPSFSLDVWSDTDLSDPEIRPLSHCPSHMELAAMVIRVPAQEHKRELRVGDCHINEGVCGWAVKFLDDGNVSEASCGVETFPRTFSLSAVNGDSIVRYGNIPAGNASCTESSHMEFRSHSSMNNVHQQSFRETRVDLVSEDRKPDDLSTACMARSTDLSHNADFQRGMLQSAAGVTIILPMGDHGLPNGESTALSPLIDRWRSGGKCDCGGWDLGCGLNVFSTQRSNDRITDQSNIIQSLSINKPLNIFSQGSRKEVILSLSVVQQGLFVLNFQAQVSPLRAFATAVAILHNKISLETETCMKMHNLGEGAQAPPQRQYKKSSPGLEERDDSSYPELYTDFQACSASDPLLSPYGRV